MKFRPWFIGTDFALTEVNSSAKNKIMIRRISLLLLLANASLALSQPLYKWIEADGSITFSPTPPTSGVSFEKLGEPSPVATSLTADPLPAEATDPPVPLAPALPVTRVEYAPGNSGDLPDAISRGSAGSVVLPVNSGVAVNRAETSTPIDAEDHQSASDSAASYKQSRCQDLMKRVTSLERRLKSHLTPEDMDNTVLHMARYQRSYDQYCSQ